MRWTEGVARNLLQEPRVGGIVVYYRDVTARKATEQQLKASEDRYGHLFSSAADVIFEADAEGYFRFVNPQTFRLFEYEPGRSDRPSLHRIHPRRLSAADPAALLPADQRAPAELVHRVPGGHQVGKEVWLGQNAWIITDAAGKLIGMQAVARDITERRKAEDALRAAEAKYRALVEQSLIGVYIMQDDRLVYVNPKAADLLGYTQQELIDSPSPFDFVHEQDRPLVMRPARRGSIRSACRACSSRCAASARTAT